MDDGNNKLQRGPVESHKQLSTPGQTNARRVAQKNIRAEQVKANKTDLYTHTPGAGKACFFSIYIYMYVCMVYRNIAICIFMWRPLIGSATKKDDLGAVYFAGFSFATSLINEHQPPVFGVYLLCQFFWAWFPRPGTIYSSAGPNVHLTFLFF